MHTVLLCTSWAHHNQEESLTIREKQQQGIGLISFSFCLIEKKTASKIAHLNLERVIGMNSKNVSHGLLKNLKINNINETYVPILLQCISIIYAIGSQTLSVMLRFPCYQRERCITM